MEIWLFFWYNPSLPGFLVQNKKKSSNKAKKGLSTRFFYYNFMYAYLCTYYKMFILLFNCFRSAFEYKSGKIFILKASKISFKSPLSILLKRYILSVYKETVQAFKACVKRSLDNPFSQFLVVSLPLKETILFWMIRTTVLLFWYCK